MMQSAGSGFRSPTHARGGGAMGAFHDRTHELRQIFDLFKRQSTPSVAAPNSSALTAAAVASASSASAKKTVQQQSEELRRFNDAASRFSVDLSGLAETVANMTRLTQGSGASTAGADAFEENSAEISRLTQVVRSRLQQLHDDLNALAELKEASDASVHSTAVAKHNDAVVSALRSKLVGTGNSFRSVLQKRTQTMKDAGLRRSKLLADRSGSYAFDGDASKMFRAAFSAAGDDGGGGNADGTASSSGAGAGTSSALTQQHRNTSYLRDRQAAVHEIEVAVREVSEIVQDFTRLVYEQDETIVRIDNDVDDALNNVEAGTGELMKYMASLTSQRGFILKVLAVLFCFLLFFGFVIVR